MPALRISLSVLFALFLGACGGDDDASAPPPPPPPAIVVTLGTATPTIQAGQTAQFQATVTGSPQTQVTFSVEGGAANGSINASGLYTAPGTPGVFTVRATSTADTTRSATATVTVTAAPSPAITITPSAASVVPGGSVSFSTNLPATFSVVGSNAGSVTSTGPGNAVYTAPPVTGTFQVVATSTADATRQATATVSVNNGASFRITGSTRIAPGSSTQLTALLNGVPVNAAWTIMTPCTGCSITGAGLFQAGTTVQSVTIRATDQSSPAFITTTLVTIANEVILTLFAPPPGSASITAADLLTFNTVVSPDGIDRSVAFTTSPGTAAGQVIAVDYFHGWVPPSTPGHYTITAASVADPGKTASIPVQVTSAPATALVPTAGPPASNRYDHAAAALADGRVVVVGGLRDRQGYVPVLASEVFDPQTGRFRAGPSLAVERVKPEAVAIDGERVLVTGGREDYQTARNTAEILNLSTGVASAAGNTMSARRIHHAAVRLATGPNSGKVLVVGGFNGPVPYGVPTWLATDTADLFDPATGTFAASGARLNTARGLFTATPLADGRVLIVGGIDPSASAGTLASAELYDPAAGTFAFTGSMATPRFGHTATRLPDGKVLIVGGDRNAATQSSAEIYDPATGQFTAAASLLAVTRIHHAAAALGDGRVLVFGGESGDFVVRGTVEVFDPATRAFSVYARMSTARVRATATPLPTAPGGPKVLVFGGGADARGSIAETSP